MGLAAVCVNGMLKEHYCTTAGAYFCFLYFSKSQVRLENSVTRFVLQLMQENLIGSINQAHGPNLPHTLLELAHCYKYKYITIVYNTSINPKDAKSDGCK